MSVSGERFQIRVRPGHNQSHQESFIDGKRVSQCEHRMSDCGGRQVAEDLPKELYEKIVRKYSKEWAEVQHTIELLRSIGDRSYQVEASEDAPVILQLDIQ